VDGSGAWKQRPSCGSRSHFWGSCRLAESSGRLACSPAGPDLFVQSQPVVAADAVYIVADGNPSQTEIVRIAR